MAKFEDLVAELNNAQSVWDLSRVPLYDAKSGITDLLHRLQTLESHAPHAAVGARVGAVSPMDILTYIQLFQQILALLQSLQNMPPIVFPPNPLPIPPLPTPPAA